MLAGAFYTKIVDYKGESDWEGRVSPKGRCLGAKGIAVFVQVFLQSFVDQFFGLFQAWHAFSDLHVHPAVHGDLGEVVLFHNFLWS